MNQKFGTETVGSIQLGDAIPPATLDQIRTRLESVSSAPWYLALGPVQRGIVDQIVDGLLTGNAADVTVNYRLDKAPTTPWNALVGGNLDLSRKFSVRAEVGFSGRTSAMLSAVYHLDW
jgi:hypothetical protein